MTTPNIQAILAHKGNEVLTTTAEEMVADAVTRMSQRNVGALVVLDGRRPIGIFSERDVLARVVASGRDPAQMPVGDAMTADPITIGPDVSVEAAMVLVTEKRCRHLPVVESGQLVGLVSIGDLLRWLLYDREEEIDELRHSITDTPAGVVQSSTG